MWPALNRLCYNQPQNVTDIDTRFYTIYYMDLNQRISPFPISLTTHLKSIVVNLKTCVPCKSIEWHNGGRDFIILSIVLVKYPLEHFQVARPACLPRAHTHTHFQVARPVCLPRAANTHTHSFRLQGQCVCLELHTHIHSFLGR